MNQDLSLCGQEVRLNDHDQFICGLFAPDGKADVFYALHYFQMETARIRDKVQEAHLGLIRLQWWRDLVEAIYADEMHTAENGMHKEFATVIAEKKIDQIMFNRYFNARAFDMEDTTHDDMAALLRYCEATGGAMAQIKAQGLGLIESEANVKTGSAIALTSIVRSLPFQARVNRCKIPKALMVKNGLDLKDFQDFTCTDALRNCVEDMVQEIEGLISSARQNKVESNVILLSTVAIEDYLKRLKKADYNPFNPNIGGGRVVRQLKVAFKAWRKTY